MIESITEDPMSPDQVVCTCGNHLDHRPFNFGFVARNENYQLKGIDLDISPLDLDYKDDVSTHDLAEDPIWSRVDGRFLYAIVSYFHIPADFLESCSKPPNVIRFYHFPKTDIRLDPRSFIYPLSTFDLDTTFTVPSALWDQYADIVSSQEVSDISDNVWCMRRATLSRTAFDIRVTEFAKCMNGTISDRFVRPKLSK